MKTELVLLSYESDYNSGDAWSLLEHLGFDALGSDVVAPLTAERTQDISLNALLTRVYSSNFRLNATMRRITGPEDLFRNN